MTNKWVQIYTKHDLIENAGVATLCDGRQVAIFYIPSTEKKLFALDNHDPFSGGNVLSRGIVGDRSGQLIVASPVYKQHFDLSTVVSSEDEDVRVAVWPIKMVDEQVIIGLP